MSERLNHLRFELTQTKLDLYQAIQKLNDGHVVELVRYLDQATEKVERLLNATKLWED